jgi:UDP-N-acetylmuramoylalanine--D-glutamate ligase
MDHKAYFASLRDKQVLVLGLGISNRPLVRMLLEHGISVTACDKTPREKADREVLDLEQAGATLKLGDDYLEDLRGDVVFRTPGMHPDTPAIAKLRENGAVITSEMEAFFAVCPCKMIAVTGSDGKTTTTTLISELLKQAGKTVWVGGNIGAPLLPEVANIGPDDIAVLELSSFQLMTMTQSPDVAVVTNVSPNHLDIHKDYAEYIAAKENVYLHQNAQGTVVLNLDNEVTRSFGPKAKGHVRWFSRQQTPEKGVWLENGVIYRTLKQAVLDTKDILLPGIHNVENYMAAICAVEGLVSDDDIRAVARTFGGVEHRIELVREKDGVRYYNDSIASSPSRTIAGLRSFDQKLILIAGGKDKGIAYDDIGPEIVAHVKTLVLTGMTAGKIRAATEQAPGYVPGSPEILDVEDFADAVKTAAKLAKPGDVVILSPASTSFDRFKNFMERGDTFKKIVMEL